MNTQQVTSTSKTALPTLLPEDVAEIYSNSRRVHASCPLLRTREDYFRVKYKLPSLSQLSPASVDASENWRKELYEKAYGAGNLITPDHALPRPLPISLPVVANSTVLWLSDTDTEFSWSHYRLDFQRRKQSERLTVPQVQKQEGQAEFYEEPLPPSALLHAIHNERERLRRLRDVRIIAEYENDWQTYAERESLLRTTKKACRGEWSFLRASVKGSDNKKRQPPDYDAGLLASKKYKPPFNTDIVALSRIPDSKMICASNADLSMWSTAIKMPQELASVKIRKRGARQGHTLSIRTGAGNPDQAKPLFNNKHPFGDLFITDEGVRETDEPTDTVKIRKILRVFFHGASRDEVEAYLKTSLDEAWAYLVRLRPAEAENLSETKKRQLLRTEEKMKQVYEGKCPSGTCPNNRCANPKLSFAERQDTHALNLSKMSGGKVTGRVGEWYCVVELNSQPRIKWLPDVSQFEGKTEEDRAEAAFEELVRRELVAAANQARKDGGDPEAARHRRKAAFAAVTNLCKVVSERFEKTPQN